jgi:hypothetical protein
MKGQEVDFDILEIGARPSELKIKDEKIAREIKEGAARGNRVDLGKVADESKAKVFTSDRATPSGLEGDFVSLDFAGGAGKQFEALNYNHKLRRKLHRAIEAAQIQKELLVRARAKEHCESNGMEVPTELAVEYKPIKLSGRRILEDGTLETEKQERVRKRLELAEYNKAAKVLRQQAKAEAIEAGLRVFAELTSKKPTNDANGVHHRESYKDSKSPGTTRNNIQHDDPQNESSKKRRRESEASDDAKAKKSKKSSAPLYIVPVAESKKVETPIEVAVPKEAKSKAKKRKTSHDDGSNNPNQFVDDDDTQKEKKRLKKEHKQQKAAEVGLREITVDHEPPAPEERGKKSKKSKRHKADPVEASSADGGNVKTGEQWNPDALHGDAARKDKFLRLMGASKTNGNGTEKPTEKVKAKAKAMIEQVEDELERQFEAGIRMKNDGQRKKGLGA